METLSIIYWSRVGLGVVAALMSLFLGVEDSILLAGLSIAMAIYILTYYVFKRWFIDKVETQSKLFTTGIGAYFIIWIVAWTLFYTLTLLFLGRLPAG